MYPYRNQKSEQGLVHEKEWTGDTISNICKRHDAIYYNLGNHIGALTYLDKALAIDPKDEDALYEKGVVLNKLGNHTGAIEYFDKALVIDLHDVDALNNKGVALSSLGNYTDAIRYYDKTLAIDPSDENELFQYSSK